MRRRAFLALVGSLTAGSGCGGSGNDDAPGGTVTPMSVPSNPVEGGPGAVEIAGATVQPGVAIAADDRVRLVDGNGQYLVVDLAGDTPDRSAVEFRFDGEHYTPESFYGPLYRGDLDGVSYGDNGGPLVFALPESGDGTDAKLAWETGSWTPQQQVVGRLEDPLPQLWAGLDAPDTDAELSAEKVTVSVTNEGESAGRYVLTLNRTGPSVDAVPVARLTGELAAGASETHSFTPVPPEDGNPTRYILWVPNEQDYLSHLIRPAD